MGGNAFKNLGQTSFPRIAPARYCELKAELTSRLLPLFELVGTPAEAPQKHSHGDIDFVVANPRIDLPVDKVKRALNAEHAILSKPTSNYAIPTGDGNYHQIDVHLCTDADEWERVMFFHSYGDLGIILSSIARPRGLRLGLNGLKLVAPPIDSETSILPPSFQLSQSFSEILDFFGLSMKRWKAGFLTQRSIFDWAASSRFFDPHLVKSPSDNNKDKSLRNREMYQSYVEYSRSLLVSGAYDARCHPFESLDVVRQALQFFKKEHEYDSIVAANRKRIALKNAFSGQLVMEWTGASGIRVRDIMDQVRSKYSEDEIIHLDPDALRSVSIQIMHDIENGRI